MESESNTQIIEGDVKETNTVIKGHDEEGRSTINQYTFIQKLGEGTYGKVKLAFKDSIKNKYAIKIIKKDVLKRRREMIRDERGRIKYKDAFQNVLREIAVMKKLHHENLVKLHEVIDNVESCKLYLVMEVAEKGQLIEWDEEKRAFYNISQPGEHLEEDILRNLFSDMVHGLYYLHTNGIVHRDIKPQNILMTADGTVKIADFGVADIVGDHDVLTKTEGTYHFLAPECVSIDPDAKGWSGKTADIWALGITFYAFIYYRAPFDSTESLELFEKISTHDVHFPEERHTSNDLRDLLKRLLEKDPSKRITLDGLIDHPWFHKDEVGPTLVRKCSKVQTVIITPQDIHGAVTQISHTIFLKIMAKKMVNRFRTSSASMKEKKADMA